MKKSMFFISCEEAKIICDKAQYNEASFFDKIKLYVRLTYCHVTRSYSKKNKQLSQLIKNSKINYYLK